jgi:DNA-binding CsgD family transcriptional regulator
MPTTTATIDLPAAEFGVDPAEPAAIDGRILSNPAQYVQRPYVHPSERRGLDRGELGRFLFAAERFDHAHAALAGLTVAPGAAAERVSFLLAAHGLTPAQRRVASLVLQSRTTQQIVIELRISAHTVQDHLKAAFDKVGVRSRRELVKAWIS